MLIKTTKAFEKDLTRMQKRGKDLSKLEYLIKLLANNDVLQAKYRDHKLLGNYQNLRECHIEPDWLLIYENLSIFKFFPHQCATKFPHPLGKFFISN